MAKVSQLDRALASLRAERDILDMAIRKLEAQQVTQGDKDRKAERKATKSRARRSNGEGATTDSGNMNYPPA